MSFAIRAAVPADLPVLVALAERCQADPQRRCVYISDDAAAISRDVEEVPDWIASTLVALDDQREVIGWVLADQDPDLSRIWWWGPFVVDVDRSEQLIVASALLGRGLQNHPDHDQHELAADRESVLFAELADQHGFHSEEGSLALRLDQIGSSDSGMPSTIVPVCADDEFATAVAALHDQTFPGTHSTGEMLLRDIDDEHAVYASVDDGSVTGYVAVELHHDGSFYIDYLGVDPEHRLRGIGRGLVAAALSGAPQDRTYAHLTVREDNAGARALYASLGFVEALVLAPYRKGFSLD